MKKYLMLLISISTVAYAASGFTSTQDAINEIFNTYNNLEQMPNLYDKNVSFKDLVELGDRLNTHIMKKQGLLLGSTSNRKGILRKPSGEDGNIFDLWELQAFTLFTQLITTIKTVRLIQSLDNNAAKLLTTWHTNGAFQNVIANAKAIRKDAILSDKKKLADIIIFFMERNIDLINKAVTDLKNLKT